MTEPYTSQSILHFTNQAVGQCTQFFVYVIPNCNETTHFISQKRETNFEFTEV